MIAEYFINIGYIPPKQPYPQGRWGDRMPEKSRKQVLSRTWEWTGCTWQSVCAMGALSPWPSLLLLTSALKLPCPISQSCNYSDDPVRMQQERASATDVTLSQLLNAKN